MNSTTAAATPRRAYWLKTLHQWHWVSSALSLMGMLIFAFTGITLNHATDIEAKPIVVTREAQLPAPLLAELNASTSPSKSIPLQAQVWLTGQFKLDLSDQPPEWSDNEVYFPLPRTGSDAWLRIDRHDGRIEYEHTDRGWIAYFNDLHKGRHTGAVWRWFIDLFAVACLVFSITGLLILKLHAVSRPMVWPLTAWGLVLPLLLAILFIH